MYVDCLSLYLGIFTTASISTIKHNLNFDTF